MTPGLQPDQQVRRWSEHVHVYETAFEPLTDRFAAAALRALPLGPGARCLDVAAGSGGAALAAARTGAQVVAIDAAEGMAARIRERARAADLPVAAAVMDAARLALKDSSFDAALSLFGLILCPDAPAALREAVRTVVPGGPVAVVTWTEPQNYELIGRLLAAVTAVRGPQPPPPGLPAQLRFCAEGDFRALLAAGGLEPIEISRLQADLEAPSASWLAARLTFAPGLADLLAAQGEARESVVARFVTDLERDQGRGAVRLKAVAFLGLGRRSETLARSGP
ncbi:class I SAM-dependent methyltransferase [Methylobacterium nigriterrae]|uniref:class I SAM-dependent methyltransferase n=1 Tax=Methylobacterium nigriterrae TaxID=3127512 RepID=UPI0030132FA1